MCTTKIYTKNEAFIPSLARFFRIVDLQVYSCISLFLLAAAAICASSIGWNFQSVQSVHDAVRRSAGQRRRHQPRQFAAPPQRHEGARGQGRPANEHRPVLLAVIVQFGGRGGRGRCLRGRPVHRGSDAIANATDGFFRGRQGAVGGLDGGPQRFFELR